MYHDDSKSFAAATPVVVAVPPPMPKADAGPPSAMAQSSRKLPGWAFALLVFAGWLALFYTAVAAGFAASSPITPTGWAIAALLHLPYFGIVALLCFGVIERAGYFLMARRAAPPGTLPASVPKVCIQLPMFNEAAVARRVIAAASAMRWPTDRFEIQVLDDSTEPDTRAMVERVCADLSVSSGKTITMIHRTDRSGYKAGALEAGRHVTDAEFIAIFDADFLPPADYLERAIPHFYAPDGRPLTDLGLVQAQWGHLNDDQSPLTASQALWVDDHHSLQQSWRSTALDFVNFTGTAGVWRAAALQNAGGWRSASLVEDCEISFRALFAGYRTKFVRDIVVPAELPQTVDAYRLQQKRWTQGWAQLQRLHFLTLLRAPAMPLRRKIGLLHMMVIGWQWPLWSLWIASFPFLIAQGLSLSASNPWLGILIYLLPPILFAFLSALAATFTSHRSYASADGSVRVSVARRLARVFPYLVINAAMLPHHLCAFVEGLFGPMHCEFERTPKTAQVTAMAAAQPETAAAAPDAAAGPAPKRARRKLKRPAYAVAEAGFVAAQFGWIVAFALIGPDFAALGALWLVLCITGIRIAPLLARGDNRIFSPRKGTAA